MQLAHDIIHIADLCNSSLTIIQEAAANKKINIVRYNAFYKITYNKCVTNPIK